METHTITVLGRSVRTSGTAHNRDSATRDTQPLATLAFYQPQYMVGTAGLHSLNPICQEAACFRAAFSVQDFRTCTACSDLQYRQAGHRAQASGRCAILNHDLATPSEDVWGLDTRIVPVRYQPRSCNPQRALPGNPPEDISPSHDGLNFHEVGCIRQPIVAFRVLTDALSSLKMEAVGYLPEGIVSARILKGASMSCECSTARMSSSVCDLTTRE